MNSSLYYYQRRTGISQAEALSDRAYCTSLGAGVVCMNECCPIIIAILGLARGCVCLLRGKCGGWCEAGDVSEYLDVLFGLFTL